MSQVGNVKKRLRIVAEVVKEGLTWKNKEAHTLLVSPYFSYGECLLFTGKRKCSCKQN